MERSEEETEQRRSHQRNGRAFLVSGRVSEYISRKAKKSIVGEAWDSRLWRALPSVRPRSSHASAWGRVTQCRSQFGSARRLVSRAGNTRAILIAYAYRI